MEAPTDTEDVAAKRRRLEAMLRARAATPRDLPLSVGQERLHRLARLDPSAPFYNVAVAYRLEGPLAPEAVARATRRLAERHEVLRTTFPAPEGTPVQRIAPTPPEGLFALHDTSPAALDAALAAEAAQPFDLAAGPLWRVALFRLGPEAHVLALTMHHIVTDGWSFTLLLRELALLMAAFARGAADPLDAPAVQYAAYAERQRAGFADPGFAAQQTHWQAHLAGRIPPLALPTDREGAAADDRAAASLPLDLPPETGQRLAALGKAEGATAFMLALTAFAALLHRWTGQTDLLLCTPVTGRHRAQTREVVGYCNNILPIRLDLSGAPSLRALLHRVRAVTLDAHRNQDVPFETIAEAPALRRIPLSRLLFSLDMVWPPAFAPEGLEAAPLRIETGAADFDLSVSLWPVGEALDGTLRYKTALFTPERVAELASAFHATLATLADAPDTPLAALPAGAPPSSAAAASPKARAPRFPLEERLARVWRAVFDAAYIGIDDDFRRIGASSLAVAELAERLQAELGTTIDLPLLFRTGTIARLARALGRSDAALGSDPLAPIRSGGTKPALFLFEGVSIYYPLTERLAPGRPVWGLVRPLVSDFAGVKDMAAAYVAAIRRAQPEGPYNLGGISFGGLVAFEAAQQLTAAGAEVGLVALFDTPAPGAYRPKGPLGRLLGHAGNLWRFGRPYVEMKLRDRQRRTARVAANPAPAGGLDTRAQRASFRRYARRYQPEPYAGPILLFTLDQRDAMSDSLFDPALGHVDPQLGWGAIARGRLDCVQVGGDHIGLLREPNVAEVAAALETRLA